MNLNKSKQAYMEKFRERKGKEGMRRLYYNLKFSKYIFERIKQEKVASIEEG